LENITAFGDDAFYRTTPNQVITEVLREGKPIAPGAPTLCNNSTFTNNIHLEQNGNVWFAPLTVNGANCQRRALFRSNPSGVTTEVIRIGSPVSGTASVITDFFGEVIGSGSGDVFFEGRESGSSTSNWYLARANSAVRITPDRFVDRFAGRGETLTEIESTLIRQFRGGSAVATDVIRRGQPLPQGQGQFFTITDADVSSENVIVATAQLTGTPGGSSDDSGIYLADSNGIVEIAREGRPAIAPNSTFRNLPDFTQSARVGAGGRVYFQARYQVGNSVFSAWFYFDRQSGLREILNTNTTIEGLRVTNVDVEARFNERGELPMRVRLADNRDYIVLFTLPRAPQAPDLNGDGNTDLIWYNSTTGTNWYQMRAGSSVLNEGVLLEHPSWRVVAVGDLDGDFRGDLIWYNPVSGENFYWIMDGANRRQQGSLLVHPSWRVTHTGDFNGDGRSDLLWLNPATGETHIWLMDGGTRGAGGTIFTHPSWRVSETADVDGDGKDDLIWTNEPTGETFLWLMNGLSPSAQLPVLQHPSWRVVATGDINGDQRDDLLWYNRATGESYYWIMSGAVPAQQGTLLVHPSWVITGTADTNGDGRSDLLWFNPATGQSVLWLMNGATVLQQSVLSSDGRWRIVN
jgi:hypothetical protein